MKEDKFVKLMRFVLSLQENGKAKKELEENLNTYLSFKLLSQTSSDLPKFNSPDEETASGDYLIGIIPDGEPYQFCIREEEMLRHILIVGSSGAGKTNTVFLLVKQLLAENKPFLIFDWKRNYRDLLTLEETKKEILAFTVNRKVCPFPFNPLIPPRGTDPHIWLSKLIEIICHAYFLGEGVVYLLSKTISDLYTEFGAYNGSETFPTFRNVLNALENYESKGRETQWLTSALRAIFMICFSEANDASNTDRLADLLNKNVILELDALTENSKIFLVETLLLWLHHYRMAEGKREQFKHACIIEEAHHMLSNKTQQVSGTEAIPDIIMREIREFGESVIVVDQDPSLLSTSALGNTYTTICLNLKYPRDVNLMSSIFFLDAEEKEFLSKLEMGEAIVKLQGRHTDPFFIKIPKVNMPKGSVTDEILKSRMANYYEELDEIRREYGLEPENRAKSAETKGAGNEHENNGDTETNQTYGNLGPSSNETRQLAGQLSEKEKALLIDILQNPISKVRNRYERLAVNEYQGNKVQQKLLEKQLIKEVKLPNLEGRGYWGKTFELTYLGKRILQELGFPVKEEESKRRGGLQHKHLVKLIALKLRTEGHDVEEEFGIGQGKATDLVVDRKVAIEVEREGKNVIENVTKNLEIGFKVVIACEATEKQRIEEKLRQAKLDDKATIIQVSELMKRPLSEFIPPSRSAEGG